MLTISQFFGEGFKPHLNPKSHVFLVSGSSRSCSTSVASPVSASTSTCLASLQAWLLLAKPCCAPYDQGPKDGKQTGTPPRIAFEPSRADWNENEYRTSFMNCGCLLLCFRLQGRLEISPIHSVSGNVTFICDIVSGNVFYVTYIVSVPVNHTA